MPTPSGSAVLLCFDNIEGLKNHIYNLATKVNAPSFEIICTELSVVNNLYGPDNLKQNADAAAAACESAEPNESICHDKVMSRADNQ